MKYPKIPRRTTFLKTGKMTLEKTHHRAIYLWAEGHEHRQIEVHNEAVREQAQNL